MVGQIEFLPDGGCALRASIVATPPRGAAMDLESLRGFVLVANEGSIAQAAPQMYLSVSALSRRLQELERQLGVKLFERTSRGIAVSNAGKRLLGHATAVLQAADEMCAAVSVLDEVPEVRLGLSPGVESALRNDVLDVLRGTPGASVRCVPGQNTALIRQLALGRLDLALVHQDPSSSQIPSRLVCRQPTKFMFSSSLPQAGRTRLSLSDFTGQPFVTSSALLSGAPVYYAKLRSLLGESGIDEVVDVGHNMWIRDIVSSGSGFAIFVGSTNLETVDPDGQYGLVVRTIEDLDLSLDTHLAWSRDSPALVPPVLDAVIEAATHAGRAISRSDPMHSLRLVSGTGIG